MRLKRGNKRRNKGKKVGKGMTLASIYRRGLADIYTRTIIQHDLTLAQACRRLRGERERR